MESSYYGTQLYSVVKPGSMIKLLSVTNVCCTYLTKGNTYIVQSVVDTRVYIYDDHARTIYIDTIGVEWEVRGDKEGYRGTSKEQVLSNLDNQELNRQDYLNILEHLDKCHLRITGDPVGDNKATVYTHGTFGDVQLTVKQMADRMPETMKYFNGKREYALEIAKVAVVDAKKALDNAENKLKELT